MAPLIRTRKRSENSAKGEDHEPVMLPVPRALPLEAKVSSIEIQQIREKCMNLLLTRWPNGWAQRACAAGIRGQAYLTFLSGGSQNGGNRPLYSQGGSGSRECAFMRRS